MDRKTIEKYVSAFGLPVLTVVAGLILLVNPNGAAALVAELIGWILVVAGAATLIVPTMKKVLISVPGWICGGLLIMVGILLLTRPMILADGIGRFFGILLLIEGIRNLRTGGVRVLTISTIVAGFVLVIVPRTLTQTLLGVCGLVLIVIGGLNILDKFKTRKRLEENKKPNIIDADT